MSDGKEPSIAINGKMLSTGQAMTVRVAVNNFLIELQDDEFMEALGKIGPAYRDRLVEITKLMMRTP